jgi:crotonobetainyl-CoA:carnitine CoA-transferase CaiB-like acyl-CoA transferase
MMDKALEGIRVIEFTHVISGPFCGMLLGDLGAEMIKIENPGSGDYTRTAGAKTPEGISLWYPAFNRNKKSITLNLKDPKAREIVRSLVAESDVVVENFRPGLLDEMGLGYETLKGINSRIIMASISGFGKTGPYEKKTAFDMTTVAMSGFMAVNGLPDAPMKTGPAISDFLAGLYGALAIVSALRYREHTGKGQFIDVSMMDSAMSILESAFAELTILKRDPKRIGNRRPNNSPSTVFKAVDDYIYIAALFQTHWEKLCRLMHREDLLAVAEYKTMQDRYKCADEIEAIVANWVKDQTAEEVLKKLEDELIPCARVNRLQNVLDDPNVKARNSIVEFDYPGVGKYPVVAFTPRFSEIAATVQRPPLLGENNFEILGELLGYSSEELKKLESERII